jgi:hypothetical protein
MENDDTDPAKLKPNRSNDCYLPGHGDRLLPADSLQQSRKPGELGDIVIKFSKVNTNNGDRDTNLITTRSDANDIDEDEEEEHGKSRDSDYFTSLSSPSPESRDATTRLSNGSVRANGQVVHAKLGEKRFNGYESSSESYNERILRSCAWPLSEGSNRLGISTNNHENSMENTRDSRAESCNSDSSDDNDADSVEKKEFSFRTLTRDQIAILIATSFTNLLSFLSLSILAPFFPIEVSSQ